MTSSTAPAGFPPPPPSSGKKQGLSGCAIAAIVAGVLLLVGGLVVVGGIMIFLKSPEGQAAKEMMNVAIESTRGPGVDAMTKAGCKSAAVVDLERLNNLGAKVDPDGGPMFEGLIALQGVCNNPPTATTCDELGPLVAQAQPVPAGRFLEVDINDGETSRCKSVFDAAGKKVDVPPAPTDTRAVGGAR